MDAAAAIRRARGSDRGMDVIWEAIPSDGFAVVIDTNAYFGMMEAAAGEAEWDGRISERYHHRLAVPRKVVDKVASVLPSRTGHDATLLPEGRDMLSDVAPDGECLRGLERVHRMAADNPDSRAAGYWLDSKSRILSRKFRDPGGLKGERRGEALEFLYRSAADDREIAAVAAAIAARDGKAYLVTSDADMVLFQGEVYEITGRRLHVRRPEAAGARGRRDPGEARGGRAPAPAREGYGEAAHDRYMVGKGTTAILFDAASARRISIMLRSGGKKTRSVVGLRDAWEYVSSGGGRGRAGVTEAVRAAVAKSAEASGYGDGLGRLLEAACLGTDVRNRPGYAAIVEGILGDNGVIRTDLLARGQEPPAGSGAPPGGRRGEGGGEGAGAAAGGVVEKSISMAAEAMCAAEEREVVLVTDEGTLAAIKIPLLRKTLEMRTRGERMNPVWVMGTWPLLRAVRTHG